MVTTPKMIVYMLQSICAFKILCKELIKNRFVYLYYLLYTEGMTSYSAAQSHGNVLQFSLMLYLLMFRPMFFDSVQPFSGEATEHRFLLQLQAMAGPVQDGERAPWIIIKDPKPVLISYRRVLPSH